MDNNKKANQPASIVLNVVMHVLFLLLENATASMHCRTLLCVEALGPVWESHITARAHVYVGADIKCGNF